jgi:endonuclease III
MVNKKEIITVLNILEKSHGLTMLEQLKEYTPFQLLVATLLSSRTKDSTTIPIVKEMFKKYSNPEDFVDIEVEELEKMLYGIGFYRTKAKHVKELAKIVIEKFGGKIPDNFEDLTSLPGVGRKTANCILSYAFHTPAIAVDTHVHRIVNRERLAWINTNTPEETEEALKEIIPKERWNNINKLLVDYGQRVCFPVKPNCDGCVIIKYCEYEKNKEK